MYKIIGLAVWLLAVMCVAHGQYTVTKVVGQVKNKSTGEQLKPGSKLKDDDMLEFSAPKDMVRVIVSGKGIYVISPTPRTGNSPSAIVEMLKATLKVKSREGYLSGRSEESDFIPEVLETEAAVNTRIHVGAQNKYLFDVSKFDVSTGNRFFLQLDVAGGNSEIHALTTVGDTLLLQAADFAPRQQVEGKITYKIGFFRKDKNTSESLAVLNPYVDTEGEMEAIMNVMAEEGKGISKDSLRTASYAEVYESLGKPSKITFDEVFNRLAGKQGKKAKQ
ncbi:MAG: hypothetical protein JNK79_04150 [Chitinophagaceae bacterium]|nr:hypothetical protein [Chitinophagaceae bacterium]